MQVMQCMRLRARAEVCCEAHRVTQAHLAASGWADRHEVACPGQPGVAVADNIIRIPQTGLKADVPSKILTEHLARISFGFQYTAMTLSLLPQPWACRSVAPLLKHFPTEKFVHNICRPPYDKLGGLSRGQRTASAGSRRAGGGWRCRRSSRPRHPRIRTAPAPTHPCRTRPVTLSNACMQGH